jgi:hypothetical protein
LTLRTELTRPRMRRSDNKAGRLLANMVPRTRTRSTGCSACYQLLEGAEGLSQEQNDPGARPGIRPGLLTIINDILIFAQLEAARSPSNGDGAACGTSCRRCAAPPYGRRKGHQADRRGPRRRAPGGLARPGPAAPGLFNLVGQLHEIHERGQVAFRVA